MAALQPSRFDMEAVLDRASTLWSRAVDIWIAGDWGMLAIAINALVLFGLGIHIYLNLRATKFHSVSEKKWRRWIRDPSERRGPVGELLDLAMGGRSLADTASFFDGVRKTHLAPFERDLRVMRICVASAPLLGLFGTVTGMLATFAALSSGSGGEKTMGLIAKGISEALITTETGLVVALPGLFFQYQLTRRFERYKEFLAHVESACMQHQYWSSRAGVVEIKKTVTDSIADAVAVPQR
jgi:biopolymer transport protein ExbB